MDHFWITTLEPPPPLPPHCLVVGSKRIRVTFPITTPCVPIRLVVAPLQGPGQYPAGALAGVVSLEPGSWCVGAVPNVAWCAVCASAAPNNWGIEDVLVVAKVV